MKARVTIEYDVLDGDQTGLRDSEEQGRITCETHVALRSATARVELIEER